MTDEDALNHLSPGELFALLSEGRSPIDPNKSIEELSYAELLMLEQHEDLLYEYNKERTKILLAEMSREESEEPSVGTLVKELYERKNG